MGFNWIEKPRGSRSIKGPNENLESPKIFICSIGGGKKNKANSQHVSGATDRKDKYDNEAKLLLKDTHIEKEW